MPIGEWLLTQISGLDKGQLCCVGIFFIFSFFWFYYEKQKEEWMIERIANNKGAVCLKKVKFFGSSKFMIGGSFSWSQAQVISTSNSIFVFGGGRHFVLKHQFYSKAHSPPEKLIDWDKGFVPVDDIKLDGNNLIINYTSPHWHTAKCKVELKKIMDREQSEIIKEMLAQGFGVKTLERND